MTKLTCTLLVRVLENSQRGRASFVGGGHAPESNTQEIKGHAPEEATQSLLPRTYPPFLSGQLQTNKYGPYFVGVSSCLHEFSNA
jgi:hypothetical protein